MFRMILLICFSFLIFSCNNGKSDGDPVLSAPPYNAITDSIERSPRDAGLYYRRGVLLYQNNELNLAQKDIRKAWEIAPTEDYALSLTTILRQKHTDSAIVFLKEATSTLPSSVALHVGLARGYQQKGEWDQSLSIIEGILSQYPKQLDALLLKAEIFQNQSKYAEALKTMEQAYSYAPFDLPLAYELAYAYAENGNSKALALSDSLIRNDSTEKKAQAHFVKGVYFEKTNNQAHALNNYDASIRANYNFLDAYLAKGELLYNQKKYEQALNTFTLAQKISPAVPEFYYWVARCQEAMGMKAEAKLNYQRAYGLDPSFTEAKEAAGKL